ncbi:ATP-binding protein [Ruminococcaceae bacterium OttesenSCG-928-O06]|nr:ATP-binding protein [Ruminococcaceae bacterium OttesenSCG-928-O06]
MENPIDAKRLAEGLHALALFRPLLHNEVLGSFLAFLDKAAVGTEGLVDAYCAFVAALYRAGGDFGALLQALVLESENPVVLLRARGDVPPAEMAESLARELSLFDEISMLPPAGVALLARGQVALPQYATSAVHLGRLYAARLDEVATKGYGIFAVRHMFTLGENGTLVPVRNPDPQRLSGLVGYERERAEVVLNTEALLRGLPANNILLYGDAGTGKSSTVKALANEYRDKGLRLVEVQKNQLYQIPRLMDTLAENPLKFILFIDDLSFPENDGDFTALKAILEGNISARPGNIVVYATSNRRHMVRQRHAERMGDEVHVNDALEEGASLSARFGLTITFLRPDKELYLGIVQALAAQQSLQTPLPALLDAAEAHALRHGGRSPRTARQFVEYMKAKEQAQHT